jgi:CubicO group peptidase (beta-lactamase class C family)
MRRLVAMAPAAAPALALAPAVALAPAAALALALAAAPAAAAAQESIASGAGSPATDRDGAGRGIAARIDAVFADLTRAGSPGCSVAVVRDGRTIHARGYGLASLEHQAPNRPDTVFDIASVSKQFTAAGIALLAIEGRLSLDDPIAKHVPEMAPTGRDVTLRQLLHHTGGLRDYLSLLVLAGLEERGVSTPADALEILARQKGVNFPPGTDHLYCNSGYFLMSEVVRRLTGRSLAAFAQERIFEPLGMRSTRFLEDQTLPVPRRATGYSAAGDGGFRIDMSQYEQTGDGAVVTTVEDLARWDANFHDPKVGGRALLDMLQTPGRLADGTAIDYALGLSIDTHRSLRRVRHSGSWAGYRAEFARYPDDRLSVICLCNLASARPRSRAEAVAAIVLGDRLAPPAPSPGAPPSTAAAALPGTTAAGLHGGYRDPRSGEIVRLRLDGDTLRMADWGDDAAVVVLGPDHLAVPEWGESVRIEPAEGGKPARLIIDGRGARPETFEKYDPATPTPRLLRDYAARYYSDEIDAALTIAVENDALVLRLPRRDDAVPLRPALRDLFEGDEAIVKFDRDANRRIRGLRLTVEGARDLRYVRQPR